MNTASPARLVTMLYDRLLLALDRSEKALGVHDTQVAHDELLRAQRIVDELRFSLDLDAGAEIAANLRDIYDFSHQVLLDANTNKDASSLHTLTTIFTELRTAWHEGVELTNAVS